MAVLQKWNRTHRCNDWYFRVYVKDRNGHLKKIAKKVGPEPVFTKSDALRAEKIFIGNYAKTLMFDADKKPNKLFKEVAGEFMEKYSKATKKSWKNDEDRINNLNPFFGNKYLDEIDSFMVQRYQAQRVKEVSGSTVNRELACMKSIFNKAIDWGWATVNPVKGIKFFRENGRLRYLNPEELNIFIKALDLRSHDLPYLKPVIMLAMSTGMRESEIFNLKRNQINTVTNQIVIHDPKSGRREIVRLNEAALEALKSVKKRGEYVFYNTDGKRLKSIRRAWYTLLKRAGIKDFRFHDLRHCFGSYLSMQGANQFDLQLAMRHRSMSMTQRYVHLMPSHLDKVNGLFDKFLDTHVDTQGVSGR